MKAPGPGVSKVQLRAPGVFAVFLIAALASGAAPASGASVGIGLDGLVADFGSLSPAQGPAVIDRAIQLTVESDAPWRVTVAASGDLVNAARPGAVLPVSRLKWAAGDAAGPWQPLSTRPAEVASGPGGEGPVTIPISLSMEVEWDDAPLPAPYRTALVYTASAEATLTASFARPARMEDGNAGFVIGYYIPGDGPVTVSVHIADGAGRPVRSVALEQAAGQWHAWVWDGKDDQGRPVPPGVYYYTVTGPGGQVLAAGALWPEPLRAEERYRERLLARSGAPASAAGLSLAARAEPDPVTGGEWLRIGWRIENPSGKLVRAVSIQLDLPPGFSLAGPGAAEHWGAAGLEPGGRWSIPAGDVPPNGALDGDVWLAVAPGLSVGRYDVRLRARGQGDDGSWPEALAVVTVAVQAGSFERGRLAARIIPPGESSVFASDWSPDAARFRIDGGPVLRPDRSGMMYWSGPPGLYLLVPDPGTLPDGWQAPAVAFRLEAGALTYIEAPLVRRSGSGGAFGARQDAGAPGDVGLLGTWAVELARAGLRLEAALAGETPGGQFRIRYPMPDTGSALAGDKRAGSEPHKPRRPASWGGTGAGGLLLPLGPPLTGSAVFAIKGERSRTDGGSLAAALSAGGPGPSWALHIAERRSGETAGMLWVRDSDGADFVGAHWQGERRGEHGPFRLATQALWPASGSTAAGESFLGQPWRAGAFGIMAAVPLAEGVRLEGAYRHVPPDFPDSLFSGDEGDGWELGVHWSPANGRDFRLGLRLPRAGTGDLDVELAGSGDGWRVRQRLVAGGRWNPRTGLILRLPRTGAWAGVNAGADGIAWALGGRLRPAGIPAPSGNLDFRWALTGGRGLEASAGWHGRGPGETAWRFEVVATESAASGPPLRWRVEWSRPVGNDGSWGGRLRWQPGSAGTLQGGLWWRGLAAGGKTWAEWEIVYGEGEHREVEIRLGGRHGLAESTELTGRMILKRSVREGAGALHTVQLTVGARRPLASGWQGSVSVQCRYQWPVAGALETGWDLGLSRELGSSWRLIAGLRRKTGPGAEPYIRLEWGPTLAPVEKGSGHCSGKCL
ncbi:MAG: hypothetical protein H0Z37_07980 [Firmicutes bacterium]|nr:hypothetical protein [Bacillota bacterium]